MNERLRMGFLLAALGILGACRSAEEQASTAGSGEQKPTQVIKDFETNDVRNGVRSMTLVSPQARLYDSRKLADVDAPVLLFYKEGRQSSKITAPFGQMQMETHAVEAWGGVTVVSSDSSTLTTERLRYDPQQRKIYSKDFVRLEKMDSITEGIGLETDPELRTVKIGRQKVQFKKGMKP